MQAIDFGRSFLTFRIDLEKKQPVTVSHKPPITLNNARVLLDSVCTILDKRSGNSYEFAGGVSCKTERVNVPQDIWTDPNADFVPIHGEGKYLNIKTWDHAGRQVMLYPPSLGPQPARQVGTWEEAFDSVKITIVRSEAQVLATPDDVVEATLADVPLIGRCVIESDRYAATVEFPVKTINAGEREHFFQTDTGPILFPDLTREPDDLIAGFELAFIAMNAPDWAEFIVRAPTPIAEGIQVYHYSKTAHLTTKNTILRLK